MVHRLPQQLPPLWWITVHGAPRDPPPRLYNDLFENGLGLLLATPLFPLPGYRERAESARSEPAGERANPKKEAPDRLNRGRGRMLGGEESINGPSPPRKTQEFAYRATRVAPRAGRPVRWKPPEARVGEAALC